MAMISSYYSFKIAYITSHATAPSQVSRQTPDGDDKYRYTITTNDIPTLEADGYVFGGWEYNGSVLAAGNVIYVPSENATLTFSAVWQKEPTTYVLVDKSDLVAMADSVREATGSEEKFDVGGLVGAINNKLSNGGSAEFVDVSITHSDAELCYIGEQDSEIKQIIAPTENDPFRVLKNSFVIMRSLHNQAISNAIGVEYYKDLGKPSINGFTFNSFYIIKLLDSAATITTYNPGGGEK